MNMLVVVLPLQAVLCTIWAIPLVIFHLNFINQFGNPEKWPGRIPIAAVNILLTFFFGTLVMDLHWLFQASPSGAGKGVSGVMEIVHLAIIAGGITLGNGWLYPRFGWLQMSSSRAVQLFSINFLGLGTCVAGILLIRFVMEITGP